MDTVITPSVGHAPVNTQAGVGASPGFDAIDYRRAWSRSLHEGVVSAAGWKVHADTGLDLIVVVDANVDGAYVQGDAVGDQGIYYVPAHSTTITFNVGTGAAPDPASPRIDRVWLQVFDDTHDGSGLNQAQVVYQPGTPTAGATADNENGAPALPGGAVELATVLVPPAATAIVDADIRDKRPVGGIRKHDVGEIIYKASSNAPIGCSAADGGALKRNQYPELFADIGTTHGAGDGSTTFLKPDHRSRSPIAAGSGPGLSSYGVGVKAGEEKHTLSVPELPDLGAQYMNNGHGSFLVLLAQGGGSTGYSVLGTSVGSNVPHNTIHPVIGLQPYIFTGKV